MKLKHLLTFVLMMLTAAAANAAGALPFRIYTAQSTSKNPQPKLVNKTTGEEVTLNVEETYLVGECEPGMYTYSELNLSNEKEPTQRIGTDVRVWDNTEEGECWLSFSCKTVICRNTYTEPGSDVKIQFERGVDYTDSYTVVSEDGDLTLATGDYYNGDVKAGVEFLMVSSCSINYDAKVTDKHSGYFPYSKELTTSGSTSVRFTFPSILEVTVTAPADATCSVSEKTGAHYAPFTIYEEVKQETADGMTKHTFNVPSTSSQLAYRVSRPGSMTRADWFNPKNTPDITVTEETLSARSDHYFTHGGTGQYYADIYLNINQRGQLNLKSEGGYHDIVNLRTWQLTASITGNNFLEPDFYYTVLNTDFKPDNSVIEVDADGHITPKAPGTAIVQVRYNAMGFDGTDWSEIWAENTGTFVVTVDADTDAMPADNIHLVYKPENPMDAEHDILYYLSDKPGYSLTFTPQAGCTVTVANPVIDSEKNTVSYPDAFSAKNVTANADGSVTVLLTYGRNIIRTADAAGNASYQVLSAKPMTSEVCYPREDHYILPGDHVKLQFSGLYHVAGKLAGIYNSNCHVVYNDEIMDNGVLIGAGQYDFNSNSKVQRYEFDVPVTPEGTSCTVINGCLTTQGYGSGPGAHRAISPKGVNPNFTAGVSAGRYGSLPDLNVPLNTFADVDMLKVNVEMGSRVSPLPLQVIEEYFGKDAVWVPATTDGADTADDAAAVVRVDPETNVIFPASTGKTMVYLRKPGSEENLLACQVTVSGDPDFIPATGIYYSGEYEDIRIMNLSWGNWGNQQYLDASAEPENATNKKVIFTSSNPDNVAFTKAGLDTKSGTHVGLFWNRSDVAGDAYITAETEDGGFKLERPIHIMFYKPCTSLAFTTENPRVSAGTDLQLEWDIKPGDNQAAPATFSSSDESIATVDSDGKVTGVSEGTATITATSYGSYKRPVSANVEVTVFKPAGIEDVAVDAADTWSMTPNPADTYINVATDAAGQLQIFAIAGQCVLSTGVNAGDNTVDVSGLANGYYIVSLNGQSRRLIVR